MAHECLKSSLAFRKPAVAAASRRPARADGLGVHDYPQLRREPQLSDILLQPQERVAVGHERARQQDMEGTDGRNSTGRVAPMLGCE